MITPAVYRIADLLIVFRCRRDTLDRYRRAPGFPRPLPLPGAPVWSQAEVDAWIARGSRCDQALRRLSRRWLPGRPNWAS